MYQKKFVKTYEQNWTNELFKNGFSRTPNDFCKYTTQLKLNSNEIAMIVLVLNNVKGFVISDIDLPFASTSTLNRTRNKLKLKNYLTTKKNVYHTKDGRIVNYGLTYDFTGLNKKLKELIKLEETPHITKSIIKPINTTTTKEKSSVSYETKETKERKERKDTSSVVLKDTKEFRFFF